MPVTVTELAPAARFSLRVGAADRAAAGEAIGLALPERIGARATAGARSALCLGPDEWTVVADAADGAAVTAAFADLAGRMALSAVDVSDREITFRIAGPGTLDLLATGCPRDLAKMPVGAGTRTLFDTVQVVIVREAEDACLVTAWRSFVPHLRALWDLAGRELAAGL